MEEDAGLEERICRHLSSCYHGSEVLLSLKVKPAPTTLQVKTHSGRTGKHEKGPSTPTPLPTAEGDNRRFLAKKRVSGVGLCVGFHGALQRQVQDQVAKG